MVTMKQVPPKEVLDEVMDKAIRAHRFASYLHGRSAADVVRSQPMLKAAFAERSQLSRLRNERSNYCECPDCLADGRHAEDLALMDAKAALAYRNLRRSLAELQHVLTRAKDEIDEAVNLLQVQSLLSVCPDQ
jgi:hypothetical protein